MFIRMQIRRRLSRELISRLSCMVSVNLWMELSFKADVTAIETVKAKATPTYPCADDIFEAGGQHLLNHLNAIKAADPFAHV